MPKTVHHQVRMEAYVQMQSIVQWGLAPFWGSSERTGLRKGHQKMPWTGLPYYCRLLVDFECFEECISQTSVAVNDLGYSGVPEE